MVFTFGPSGVPKPYIEELLDVSGSYIHFIGHFHVRPEDLPTERILGYKGIHHLILIDRIERIRQLDTSFYDEEIGHNITLFPSYELKLHFEIIKRRLTHEEAMDHALRIKEKRSTQ
jgi:hypothetical protein